MKAALFALCFSALTLSAQIGLPGQYPGGNYPPGQYPPGQYPPGSRGPTNGPQGQGQPRQGRGRETRESKSTAAPVTTTTTGMFRKAVGAQFVLEADDHRIITYSTSGKTTVLKDGKGVDITSFEPGDRLSIDSTENEQGFFTAVSVTFEKAGTPADRAQASQTWDLPKLSGAKASSSAAPSVQRDPGDDRPVIRRSKSSSSDDSADAPKETASNDKTPAPAAAEPEEPVDTRRSTTVRPADPKQDEDDPGPPQLKRGVPAPRPASTRAAASTSAGESSNAPVILTKTPEPSPSPTVSAAVISEGGAADPVIDKARDVAGSYEETLPNFFCQQVTTRYQSDHPKQGWDAQDIVTADVAYENGHESYKNIKVGNKAVNKAMEDIEGTRSTGEFSSVLVDLLSPSTAAVFRKSGQDTIHGRNTWVYKFDVPRERSHWRIDAGGQLYYPAYRGTIWIDRQTSRVLRLEQQSRNMPLLFPFDTVESATDYDFVRLATPNPFLLPVNAEVLSCMRGTSHCSKNKIEFRNYRKFGAESDITFDDKN